MVLRCRDVSALATDFLEGDLSWRQRLAVRMHLMICDGCRAFVQQMRRTVRLVASLPVPPPSAEIEARLLGTLPDRPPQTGGPNGR
jgi:anti-sigma factor RsiW